MEPSSSFQNSLDSKFQRLYDSNFINEKVIVINNSASIFIGKMKDCKDAIEKDKPYVIGKQLVLK